MANTNKNSFCIFSYNSRGFSNEKNDLCKTLMIHSENYVPILCSILYSLPCSKKFPWLQCLHNTRIFFRKAIKDALNNGRPKNGMFIAVPKKFKGCAKEIPTNHWRLQAVTLIIPNNRILILNSYFPTYFFARKIWHFNRTHTVAIKNTYSSYQEDIQ